MPSAFQSIFGGLSANVVIASGDMATGTEQRDVILDAGAGFVFAGGGGDLYLGGGASALVDGGAGDDLLVGGGGADTLIGATGDDTLTGGDGADIFVFAPGPFGAAADAGDDRVLDFSVGEDRLDLSGRGLGFEDLAIGASYLELPGGFRIPVGTLVTFAGGAVELENVAPEAITADAFIFESSGPSLPGGSGPFMG